MLWGSLDRGPVNAGCGVWRSSGTVGVDRNRRDAGLWFSPDPSTRPLRKLTARSHLVPEPIVECGALAAVTDIRGMKESQDLRRWSSPIPARLTGDDLKDGPRSARFLNLRSANQPDALRRSTLLPFVSALDPTSASKSDPKRHRTRSKVNDRAHTSPMIEAALICPTWPSPDDDVAVDLASAGVLNEDKRQAN